MNVPRASLTTVRFGPFEVDILAGELRKHGLRIRLQTQPLTILAMMLERPGEVVTREELRQALWSDDTFVDFDHGLNNAINRLREALGDSAERPRFVETLPRRGYRFMGKVESISSAAPQALEAPSDDPPTSPSSIVSDRVVVLPSDDLEAPRRFDRRWWIAVRWAAVALLALLVFLNAGDLRKRLLRGGAPPRIQSIAVLPLENLSGDATQEYFADGMTEALITDLGKIGELRVISRTSVMHYKGTHKRLPEIARELNVEAIVEGAVLRSGDRVRITVQLVQAANDRHLWAESYERDLRDVLALQDEVARGIANEIKIKLTLQEKVRLARGGVVDPEAHEAYLRGRYEWNKWTEDGLKKSVGYFEEAVRKDPGYAQAWAGMSDSYRFLALWNVLPAQVAMSKAKSAALKAIELDETLPEAHVALSGVLWPGEWSAGEREVQRAIALNPNDAWAHQSYGYQLSAAARFDAAISEMRRALELDPIAPNEHQSLAATLYRAGHYDEALREFREVPDPDANSERRHRFIASIYERKGMQREAITEWITALRFADEDRVGEQVEKVYASNGYTAAKKAFLLGDVEEKKRKRAKSGHGQIGWIAADYALLGEKNNAIEWLDRGVRDGELPWDLRVNDDFQVLRSDARFQHFLRVLGLPL